MNDSILITVKKLIGIHAEDESFDMDILIHINAALNALSQLGVGPTDGFTIVDKEGSWSDLLLGNQLLEMAKSYVCLYTKKAFDPPQNGTAMEALNSVLSELTFRISVQVETE